ALQAESATHSDSQSAWSRCRVKVDDMEQEVANEPNKKKKKDLENALKKLQNDEKYLKAKEEVKAAEAQAQKEAERAALNGKATDKKAAEKGKKKEDTKAAPKVDAKVDEATFKEIDEAFAASGKDAADKKELSSENLAAQLTGGLVRRQPGAGHWADSGAHPRAGGGSRGGDPRASSAIPACQERGWSGLPSCGDGEPLGRSAACWLRRATVEDQSAEPGPAPAQLPPADLAIGHAC
ncbi:unnamed protein product, partial [Effrenium voratum]